VTAEPRKPGAGWWAALLLVLAPALWFLMFGPLVWTASLGLINNRLLQRIYSPMVFCAVNGPEPVQNLIAWWGSLRVPRGHSTYFEVDAKTVLKFSGPDDPFGRMWLEPASGILWHSDSVEQDEVLWKE